MRLDSRSWILLPGAVLLLASCSDTPAQVESVPAVDEALFAKGGNGKGKDKDGPGEPAAGVVELGGFIFGDQALSVEGDQSCQTCHEPSQGFAAPLSSVPTAGSVVQGSADGQFGDRKPPTAAYATLVPKFSVSGNGGAGGIFWDGRATGEVLGSPAADQAMGPFLNPKEQALPDAACVIWRISNATYAGTWSSAWPDAPIDGIAWPGNVGDVCSTWTDSPGELVSLSPGDRATVVAAYGMVALSVAAFEGTFNAFSSRFDRGQLTSQEQRGEKIFGSNGKCQQCHDNKGSQPLFTDHGFHNLGVPANPDNPAYPNAEWAFDPGLGGSTGDPAHLGKFRTPTTRNVAVGDNRTYMHNGALKTLRQVVQFYNTRDVLRTCDPVTETDPALWGPDGYGCWPAPEYPENLDTKNMGNLGLTDREVDDVVAYLRAMSDAELVAGGG